MRCEIGGVSESSGRRGVGRMRSWAEVDLGALRHNLGCLRRLMGRGVGLVPAVKANAYGHGLGLVAPVLAGERGVAMLGVASVAEAVEVRRLGVRKPILLFGACLRGEVGEVVRGGFEPMISSDEEAGWFVAVARRMGRRVRVHVKVDTGMGRLGVWHEEAMPLIERVAAMEGLQLAGVCTHFACADTDAAFTRRQWRRFAGVRDEVSRRWRGVKFHAANSAALLGFPEMRGDMARPGIAVYGSSPIRKFAGLLRPVMTWKARVVLVREVGKGRTLSYGATFEARRRMRVAVVAVGYGDGYSRAWSNRGAMLVNGRRCPVVGRVTMDQTLLDVTRAGDVRAGDEVVLMGPGLPVEELARGLGTISYEIFCNVGARVRRVGV